MNGGYIFDKDNMRFRRQKKSLRSRLRGAVVFLLATMSMAVLYYVVFSLLFSTEEERRLKHENEMYEKEFAELQRKEQLITDVVEGLKVRDNSIYEQIFHTSAPTVNPMSSVDYAFGLDTIPDDNIVMYSAEKLEYMEVRADAVEDNFARIMEILTDSNFVSPPMSKPIEGFTFAQTGASVGNKINPFYKVSIRHNGLDILAHSGEPVYATADGQVTDVIRSRKGLGNVVEISHAGGFVTRYAHLADIEVSKGRKVRQGDRIGYVGISGNSFAPHLHYEVRRDTVVLDPINHFFLAVTPEEYMNMLVMSVSTKQSMD